MDKDEYVYCTECNNFIIFNETFYCLYNTNCDNTDCEDSKSYELRPMYEKKVQ